MGVRVVVTTLYTNVRSTMKIQDVVEEGVGNFSSPAESEDAATHVVAKRAKRSTFAVILDDYEILPIAAWQKIIAPSWVNTVEIRFSNIMKRLDTSMSSAKTMGTSGLCHFPKTVVQMSGKSGEVFYFTKHIPLSLLFQCCRMRDSF